MPTPFAQLLQDLQAAQGDTAQLALVTFDFAVAHDPALKRAAEVAAIPHWFDAKTLAALLPGHRQQADALVRQLAALPMVEIYPCGDGGTAWNLHEATRLALRDRLLATDPERFRQLSRRAADTYGSADADAPDPALTCEHLYHLLAGQTEAGDAAMADVTGAWRIGFRTERLQTLAKLLEELLAARPAPPLLLRGKGQAYLNLAAARQDHQPVTVTQTLIQQAETVFERLAASDPANAAWQRDLSVSLDRLGDLAVAQGDLAGALRAFTESKAIPERLAASDPANAAWQRDLSGSLNRLGDLAVAQGDLAGALRYFQQDLAIAERLAASDPANAGWQYDLGISNERLGGVAVAQGRLDDAKEHFLRKKNIISRLAASDPANAAWQRGLWVSNGKLGDLASAQGNLPEALRLWTVANGITQRLAASDPANAAWQRDLSVSLEKLGDLAVAQGDLPAAARSFAEAKAIRERLAQSDPANAGWQRDLMVSCWRLADLCEKSGKAGEAKGWWRQANDTLAGMEQRGIMLPTDEPYLQTLRAKVAGF